MSIMDKNAVEASASWSTSDVARLADATVRQVEHWGARGYVSMDQGGTGVRRHWTDAQLQKVQWIARLVRGGLMVDRAAWVAAEIVGGGVAEFELSEGVTLVISGPDTEE